MTTADPETSPHRAPRQGAASVGAVLDRLDDHVSEAQAGRLPLGDVLHAVGDRGFGPILLALSLLVISPLGAIPVLPTLFAFVLALVAGQLLIGRGTLWLPGRVSRAGVPGSQLARGIDWMRPVAARLDRWCSDRLRFLTAAPVRRLAALAVLALCVMVPPLEFIPFAALIPMFAIALFGLAITVRDGVVMLIAFAASGAALIGGPALLLSQS